MNKNCAECNRKTVGVLVKVPETGEAVFIDSLCSGCVFKLSRDLGPDDETRKPPFKCKRCEAPVYSLRNGECVDCYIELLDVWEGLPEEIEEMPPPLGYNLIGADDLMAEMEVNHAYRSTPTHEDLPN